MAWTGVVGFFITAGISLARGTFFLTDFTHGLLAGAMGLLGFAHQSLIVLALTLENAAAIAVMVKANEILIDYVVQVGGLYKYCTTISLLNRLIFRSPTLRKSRIP